MPVELWGANNVGSFGLPGRLVGDLLLLGYIVITAYLLHRGRAQMRMLGGSGWSWLIGLSLAAYFASQFLPYPVGPQSPDGSAAYITLLSGVPILLAAAILPPTAALWVGASAGVGQMLGETHQLLTVFHYAFVAMFTAVLMQQNYMGQLYRWLRQPIVAGALGGVLLAVLAGVGAFAAGTASGMVALDVALVIAATSLWPRVLEGVVGGAIVMFILHSLPELKPSRPLVPSPTQRSLQKRLTINYLTFTAILLTLTLFVLYSVAITISTRLIVKNVSQFAEVISLADVPEAEANNSINQDNSDGK